MDSVQIKMKFTVTCYITKDAGHKITPKIDTSVWKQSFFPSGLCSTMNRTALRYVQQATTHLDESGHFGDDVWIV
jgi:hypothetical protein